MKILLTALRTHYTDQRFNKKFMMHINSGSFMGAKSTFKPLLLTASAEQLSILP
jgi:hypothetical protein